MGGSAGPQSQAIASWMVEATVQWFYENKNLQIFEVEEFFEDILNHEFNLVAEDGSVHETSKLVCKYYNLCTNTDITAENIYERLVKNLPKCDLSQCKVDSSTNDEDIVDDQQHSDDEETTENGIIAENLVKIPTNGDNNSEMMETEDTINTDDSITATVQTDSDGWTIISRKKK